MSHFVADVCYQRSSIKSLTYEECPMNDQKVDVSKLQILHNLNSYTVGDLNHLLSTKKLSWTHGSIIALSTHLDSNPSGRVLTHQSGSFVYLPPTLQPVETFLCLFSFIKTAPCRAGQRQSKSEGAWGKDTVWFCIMKSNDLTFYKSR